MSKLSKTPKPRANGGPVKIGQLYLVGDDGIEKFHPPLFTDVIPNHDDKADLNEIEGIHYVSARFVILHNPKTDKSEQVNVNSKDVIQSLLAAGWVLLNGNPDEYNQAND